MNKYDTVNQRVHSVNAVEPDEHEDSRQGITPCPVPTAIPKRSNYAWASSASVLNKLMCRMVLRWSYDRPSIEQLAEVDRVLHVVQQRPLSFNRCTLKGGPR